MALSEGIAYLIFASYFGLIFTSFAYVFKSILDGIAPKRLVEGRPFLFLRVAVAALLCTWYFMIEYMKWSFRNHSYTHTDATIGQWLVDTALFEEAWSIVCNGPKSWWWSSWICTWTVAFTAIVWAESGKRGIKHPWAYMLLGQLVAVSVASSLFLVALCFRPRQHQLQADTAAFLALPLGVAMWQIPSLPGSVGTSSFMWHLLALHGVLLGPLFVRSKPALTSDGDQSGTLYGMLGAAAIWIHGSATYKLLSAIPEKKHVLRELARHVVSHPAQGSISLDVIWVAITLLCWFLVTGSATDIVLKCILLSAVAATGLVLHTGINWALVGSIVPMILFASIGIVALLLGQLRKRNEVKRKALLEQMGIIEEGVLPGTDTEAPKMAERRMVVGFWHPYCNAGGGGERVLWTAIAHIQRVHPEVISLVYSGDYPAASKEEILAKIQDRFGITLDAATLRFIPLASRYLVDDTHWTRFTLLGQSFGSVYLAWEGLCGTNGIWGDIFIDTMGYAFTFPFIRLIAGSGLTIGAYIHYPTVSADMVRRVREGSFGVESAGAARSAWRTRAKLIYYRILTRLYATSLLFSDFTMANSSWTHAHVLSLLNKGRSGILAVLLSKDWRSVERQGLTQPPCEVLFPPCDTAGLVDLGDLESRKREIVSLAQFRPEKEQWKQIEAMAALFRDHPGYRSGRDKITLTLMGGARNAADEARVDKLRALAESKGVQKNVEFLLNAPYPEIVRRLGNASIGLNTMQDEHFGINVVEFMAAGLIPIVHGSAGPLLDIVVPHQGQKTGLHAKTPEEYAAAIHEIVSMSPDQQLRMRQSARRLAVEKFSEEQFNQGWEKAWTSLVDMSVRRRRVDGVE